MTNTLHNPPPLHIPLWLVRVVSANCLNSLHQWDPAEFEPRAPSQGGMTWDLQPHPPSSSSSSSSSWDQTRLFLLRPRKNKVKNISGRVMGKSQTKKQHHMDFCFVIWSWSGDKTGYKEQACCSKSTFLHSLINDDQKAGSQRDVPLRQATFFSLWGNNFWSDESARIFKSASVRC